MRILFVTPWFPNRTSPRHGNFVERFVELAAAHHAVEVLHVEQDPDLAAGQLEWIVELKDYGRVSSVFYGGGGARVQRLWARRRAWDKALSLREMSPQLIHAHVLIDGGIVAAQLARTLRVPFLISEHSSRFLRPARWTRWPERYLARAAAARAAAILPVSPTLARALQNRGMAGKYQVVPNVVDDTLFRPAPPSRDRKTIDLLHVSDASPNKRPELLLAAFAAAYRNAPQLRLHLATDGDLETLLQLVDFWHLPPGIVTVSGPHSITGVAELMHSADYFILTSRYETQSIVLVEALLSGLYCLSTRAGGPQDILHHDALGELLPASADRISDRLVALAKLPIPNLEQRSAIRHLARRRFGTQHIQDTMENIYQQTIS